MKGTLPWVRWTVGLLGALVLLAACGEASAATLQSSQRGQLRIAMQYDLGTLDPQVMTSVTDEQMSSNIFQGLVCYKLGTVKPAPCLATSWTMSPDGLQWDFKLRRNVQFQGGMGEMTASDVVFTFHRLLDPKTASPNAALMKSISQVVAVSDYEVRFTLSKPDPAFLDHLASAYCAILPQKAYADQTDPAHHPVGTGPYQFNHWTPQQQTVLLPFDRYWGGRPKLSKVIYVPIPDATTMYNAFASGQIDLLQVTDPVRLTQYQSKRSQYTISSVPGLITRFFGMNTEAAPFNNLKVREAVSDAINRPAMIKGLFGSLSEPADSILAPGVQDVKRGIVKYTYDPYRARQLLTEAGYPHGFTVTFTVPNIDRFTKPAQVIQQDLAAVGIKANIQVMDSQTFLARLASPQGLQMFILSRSQDATPDRVLLSWFSSSGIPQNNWARIRDPQIDNWLQQATTTLDPKTRAADFGDVQQRVVQGDYYYYIDHEKQVFAMHSKVKGFVDDPDRMIRLDNVRVQSS